MAETNNFGNTLFAVALALLIVAIVLSVGVDVTSSLEKNYVNTSFNTNQVNNESWSPANGTTFFLANPDRVDSTSFVVKNASTTLPASNYTVVVTNPASIVLLKDGSGYNGTNLNVSYSYQTLKRNVAEESFSNGTASIGELSSWLPTIALVLAASIIIGVIVLFFRRRM